MTQKASNPPRKKSALATSDVRRQGAAQSIPANNKGVTSKGARESSLGNLEIAKGPDAKKQRTTRKSRAKKYLPWEQLELTTNGFYAQHLHVMTSQLPMLTPMELRVAALVSGLLPSREIARILHVHEHAIEKHRSNIRRKFALPGQLPLTTFLQAVIKRAAGLP